MDLHITDLLAEYKTGLAALYRKHLKGVYLFGSYTRSEQVSSSDVDIPVVLDHFGNYWEEIKRTSELNGDLSLKYGVSISRVFLKDLE